MKKIGEIVLLRNVLKKYLETNRDEQNNKNKRDEDRINN